MSTSAVQISDSNPLHADPNISRQEETARIMDGQDVPFDHSKSSIQFDSRLFSSSNKANADGVESPGKKQLPVVSIHPETLRMIAYMMFWLLVLVSIILTHAFVPGKDVTDSLLIKTLGYNNICVYFDFSPARYVAAMIYAFVELPYFSYIFLNFLRIKKAGMLDIVTYKYAHGVTFSLTIELFFIAMFRMVFVVDIFASIFFHTLAFVSLQVGLIFNAINSALYYSKVVKYTKTQFILGVAYIVLLILITIIKNIFTQSAIAGHPVLDYSDPNQVNIAKAFDGFWMIFGAVLPVVIAWKLKKESPDLTFTF